MLASSPRSCSAKRPDYYLASDYDHKTFCSMDQGMKDKGKRLSNLIFKAFKQNTNVQCKREWEIKL